MPTRSRRIYATSWRRSLQRADSFGSQAATSTQKAELEKKNLMEAMRESYAREKASLEVRQGCVREGKGGGGCIGEYIFISVSAM